MFGKRVGGVKRRAEEIIGCYESEAISRNGRVSKREDGFTRNCLFEAANVIFCRNLGGPGLRGWARAIAERTGPRKA